MKLQVESDYPFAVTVTHNGVDGMTSGTHFPSVKKLEANMDTCDITVLDARAAPEDTLGQWLYERFCADDDWWNLPETTRKDWKGYADDVRKAVARGGMPNLGDWFDLGHTLAGGEIARAGE